MSMDDVRSEPERNPEEYHQVRDENEKRTGTVEQQVEASSRLMSDKKNPFVSFRRMDRTLRRHLRWQEVHHHRK